METLEREKLEKIRKSVSTAGEELMNALLTDKGDDDIGVLPKCVHAILFHARIYVMDILSDLETKLENNYDFFPNESEWSEVAGFESCDDDSGEELE